MANIAVNIDGDVFSKEIREQVIEAIETYFEGEVDPSYLQYRQWYAPKGDGDEFWRSRIKPIGMASGRPLETTATAHQNPQRSRTTRSAADTVGTGLIISDQPDLIAEGQNRDCCIEQMLLFSENCIWERMSPRQLITNVWSVWMIWNKPRYSGKYYDSGEMNADNFKQLKDYQDSNKSF